MKFKSSYLIILIVFLATGLFVENSFCVDNTLRASLGFSDKAKHRSAQVFFKKASEFKVPIAGPEKYGLESKSVKFTQVSGLLSKKDPSNDRLLMESLIASNMAALSAYFNRGCGIYSDTGEARPDAGSRKKVADGGAVTVIEGMMGSMAKQLDITIIIGGSEGKTRDGAPALKVKQVINPNAKNGIYIVHADPIENTNAQANNQDGSWVLFFLTKIPAKEERMLRKDANLTKLSMQDFLEKSHGEDLAKYKIPFCHDRYVISVNYPGNSKAEYIADFDPAGDPTLILEEIAKEHNITIEDLGKKVHVIFLKGDRTRHDYIENALVGLQKKGNEVTFGTVGDGDAFARVMSSVGLSTSSNKEWTIVLGASGAIEGFATGLTGSKRLNADGSTIGRVRMMHSSKKIPGSDLTGWNDYSDEDSADFNILGITQPNKVVTEDEYSGHERIFISSSITGSRKEVDIATDMSIPEVEEGTGYIKVTSFVIDVSGRGFIAESEYNVSDLMRTEIAIKADNDYGFLDDDVRDYAIARVLETDSDIERFTWEERLGVKQGINEETLVSLKMLLSIKKQSPNSMIKAAHSDKIFTEKPVSVDDAIDGVLKGIYILKYLGNAANPTLIDVNSTSLDAIKDLPEAARKDI